MKTRPSQLRELTRDELKRRLRELQEELFNLRFQKSIKLLTNSRQLREIRREIARIKTVLNEDRLGIRPVAH
jgi:large subunit ribosomal protein L29